MKFITNSIIEDMIVVGETYVKTSTNNREYNSLRLVCKCKVCNRIKVFQPSALNRVVSTNHRMCNHEETEHIRSEYPEFYRCWSHIKARINNPNIAHYERYGGRGLENDYKYFVDFCDDLFSSYLEHVNRYGKENTTVERRNNNLGYVKENVVWATWKEQAVNRCTTVNWQVVDILSGTVYSSNNLKELCETLGINYTAAFANLQSGTEKYKRRWLIRKLSD